MGSSSLTAFHCHAGVASHRLLGEVPSAVQPKPLPVDLSVPPSGRSSVTSLLAGGPRSARADERRPLSPRRRCSSEDRQKVKKERGFMQIPSVSI